MDKGMDVRWGQATSTSRVEPAPPLRRARSVHTGPGHGFFGQHPEVTGLRPVMLGGRFAGNYIPLRNRQLKKFMGDVDVIRRFQDVGEHGRVVATSHTVDGASAAQASTRRPHRQHALEEHDAGPSASAPRGSEEHGRQHREGMQNHQHAKARKRFEHAWHASVTAKTTGGNTP